MAGLNSIVKAHIRAAGAWAAVAGVLFAFRIGGDVTLISEFLAAGNAALVATVLGVLGNAWLASHLMAFSTMLSEKSLPIGISKAVMPAWQLVVAGIVVSQFAPVMPVLRYASIPFGLAVLGAAVFVIEARIMLGHMTKPTPLHWVHFVAAGALALSALFMDAVPAGGFSTSFLSPLFAFGWAGGVSVALFAGGLGLESYEDMRPLWVALAGLAGMLLGYVAGSAGIFVFVLGVLAFILSLAYLLTPRWEGHLNTWSERLLMAGIVAYFFASTDPEQAVSLPVLIFFGPLFESVPLQPVLIPGILLPAFAWGGAALLVMAGRRVPDKLGRTMLWAGCVGIAGPWTVTRLLFMRPTLRYESLFIRTLFIAGTGGAVWGLMALAHLLRPARGDRKRRRKLKVVE